jgi:hypothetical protein
MTCFTSLDPAQRTRYACSGPTSCSSPLRRLPSVTSSPSTYTRKSQRCPRSGVAL